MVIPDKPGRGQEQINNVQGQPQMQQSQGNNDMWTGNLAYGAVVGTRKNVKIIQSIDLSDIGLRVEVMEYDKLYGCTNIRLAEMLHFMSEVNMKCRQIAIYILNSAVKIESGAMSYYQGPLEMTTGIDSAGKFVRQAFTGKLTGEKIIMPEYAGSGLLVLEPSFKHFILMQLGPNESIICDKGMFFAASKNVNIQPALAGGVSGSLLGGEGIFQQQITGPGLVILESPVPEMEINKINLYNDVLRVDGNFALLRSASVSMNVERAGKTLVGSAASGEGLANVFRGTGKVWLAPTIKAYDGLYKALMSNGDIGQVDFNTSTGKAR